MNILITGATGYIGLKLARKLTHLGHTVTALTRNTDKLKDYDFSVLGLSVDLINSKLVDIDLSGFDIIYNCAGELKDESLMDDLHINASMKLLRRISNNSTRWVQLSSVGVYGKNITGIIEETSMFSPVGRYEVSKAEAEIKIKEYCLNNKISFSILRPSNVFSTDMPNNSLRQLVGIISRGLFFYMKNPIEVKTNYVHVDDVVDALVLCGFDENALNNDYIVSDFLTQKDFVSVVCKTLGKKIPKLFIPYSLVKLISMILSYIPYLPNLSSKVDALSTTVHYSTKKIETELGYQKQRPLSQSLVDFCRESGRRS